MTSKELLVGVGIGAALAYMVDPDRGRRRRAVARDKMVRATRKTRDALDATVRDTVNRTKGVAAAVSGRLSEKTVDDVQVLERVRARLGRVCSHPRAIDVEVSNGDVTLRGPILTREVNDVVGVVNSVRGVRSVSNQLEPHETADGVPSLQGVGNLAAGPRLDVFQRNWAPATQALVTTAGLALAGVCFAAYSRR